MLQQACEPFVNQLLKFGQPAGNLVVLQRRLLEGIWNRRRDASDDDEPAVRPQNPLPAIDVVGVGGAVRSELHERREASKQGL